MAIRIEGESSAHDAARLALTSGLALAGAAEAPALSAVIDAFDEHPDIASFAVGLLSRRCVLSFDAAGARAIRQALPVGGSDASTRATQASIDGWLAWLEGDSDAALACADALGEVARDQQWPAETIEATTLRALAATQGGDIDDGTRLARRASRMARTESLPQSEYLANIALARVRRLEGKSHLSVRILAALMRVAPAPWHPWMRWELALSGTLDADPSSSDIAAELAAGLRAIGAGDPVYEGIFARLERAVAGAHSIALDLDAFLSLLDIRRRGDDEVVAFRDGTHIPVPRGLAAASAKGDAAIYVFSAPDASATRVAARGLPLLPSHQRLADAPGRQARTESAIAQLLLVGSEGEDEEVLFETLYGFPYASGRHRGVRDVLYHRIRQRCEGRAQLVREDGKVRLEVLEPLAAPDPRCSLRPEHALLRTLATKGVATPAEASEALGIPLRTAQDALKRLAKDGACHVRKRGRKVEYEIEDTTFLEPTGVR